MKLTRVILWSAIAFATGFVLNIGTELWYGGMPVPWPGQPAGMALDARHIVGSAPFGDNFTFVPGWYVSIGDVLLYVAGPVLWVAMATLLIRRALAYDRAKRERKSAI